MKPMFFTGYQRVLGAPPDWDEHRRGRCDGLPICVDDDAFVSVWKLSWRERWAILTGANVMLEVATMRGHPPVALRTTRSPEVQP